MFALRFFLCQSDLDLLKTVYKSNLTLKARRYGYMYSQWELVFANDLRLDARVYIQFISVHIGNKNREE